MKKTLIALLATVSIAAGAEPLVLQLDANGTAQLDNETFKNNEISIALTLNYKSLTGSGVNFLTITGTESTWKDDATFGLSYDSEWGELAAVVRNATTGDLGWNVVGGESIALVYTYQYAPADDGAGGTNYNSNLTLLMYNCDANGNIIGTPVYKVKDDIKNKSITNFTLLNINTSACEKYAVYNTVLDKDNGKAALDLLLASSGSTTPTPPTTPESPAAPEPTTATLSLLALAGLAARRRRK